MSQEAKLTLNKIQAGGLLLSQIIDECLMVVGNTKAGKTSSCHILCQSPLLITHKHGQCSYSIDKNTYFPTAKIGQTPVSQTQFPNIFKANVLKQGKNSPITIFDCPGFGDNFGFYRILSNGYFHYQTFSKTPKLKFLLVIDKSNLTSGGGAQLRKLITTFTNFFTKYETIKDKILNATSFLITKVDSEITTDDIKDIMTQLRNAYQKMKTLNNIDVLSQIIDNVINNDKIFLIQKPKRYGAAQKGSNILYSILSSTVFWERNKDKNGLVNMQNINSSISNEVLDELGSNKENQNFNQHFDSFMYQLRARRLNVFQNNEEFSMTNVVQMLQKDVLDANNSNKYLEGMKKFISQNDYFDERYQQHRKKIILCSFIGSKVNTLFLNPQRNTIINQKGNMKQQQSNSKINFINKFKILEYIQLQSSKIQQAETNLLPYRISARCLATLESMNTFFINIFNNIQCYQVDEQYNNIIYKYCYIVRNMIEEEKILMNILFGNEGNRKKFDDLKRKIILGADIFSIFRNFISSFAGIQIQQLKKTYIQKRFLNKNLNPNIFNIQVIDFLGSCTTLNKNAQLQLSYFMMNYYRENIQKNKSFFSNSQLCLIGYKIYNYRISFQNQYSTDDIKNALFDLSKVLGQILVELKKFDQAIEMYQHIRNPQAIFDIYNLKQAGNKQLPNSQLIKFGKIAASYLRTQFALTLYQKAYNNSKDNSQRKLIEQFIIELYNNNINLNNNMNIILQGNNNINVSSYIQRLSNDQCSMKISSNLSKRILSAFNKEEKQQKYNPVKNIPKKILPPKRR